MMYLVCFILCLNWFMVEMTAYRIFPMHNTRFHSSTLYSLASTKEDSIKTEINTKDNLIQLTTKAKEHFDMIRKGASPFSIRVGVKKGGCSGMSYTMDIIDKSKITEDDHIELIDNIQCVI